MRDEEEIPYRSAIPQNLQEDLKFSTDEDEQSTIRLVHAQFQAGINELEGYGLVDLSETDLKVKQQIKAYRLAIELVAPLFDTLTQAIATIDQRYRQRNNVQ